VFSKACQYGTTKEKVYRNLKYVLSSLPKQICKNASLGLISLGKVNMNGIRFVLKLEFNPKN
jgi:hypothetical protein